MARIRPDPRPAPTPAQIEPSTPIKAPSPSGHGKPDIAVSAVLPHARLRLVDTEQDEEFSSDSSEDSKEAKDWEWDGKSWTVGDKAGSTYTQQFRLRVKDTAGEWHYVKSWTMSFEEFNRRFAGRDGVKNKLLKIRKGKEYESFKEFCFEVWKEEALRADQPGNRPASRLA